MFNFDLMEKDHLVLSEDDVKDVTYYDYKLMLKARDDFEKSREKSEKQAKEDDKNANYYTIGGRTVLLDGSMARVNEAKCFKLVANYDKAIRLTEKVHTSYKTKWLAEQAKRIDDENKNAAKNEFLYGTVKTIVAACIAALVWLLEILFFRRWTLIVCAIAFFCAFCVTLSFEDNPYMTEKTIKIRKWLYLAMMVSFIVVFIISKIVK